MFVGKRTLGLIGTVTLLIATVSVAAADTGIPELHGSRRPTGNVIFIHPDGAGLNHWSAARIYWYGPDALSPWDTLPEIAAYRGHMADILTGTSNGGATTHAFGYKVEGLGSFGKDGDGDAARSILALSGYPGSIMREAINKGHPAALVNDGDIAEPGTGAFVSEVGNRNLDNEIVRQILDGRPGFEGEQPPHVILAGGESFFLPRGTPQCTPDNISLDCHVHRDPITGAGPSREDGRNLLKEFEAKGYVIVRTRAEFEALRERVNSDRHYAPNVLGLFAADDIFNDVPEERLISAGLVDPSIDPNDKRTNLILFGSQPGTLGYNPPTAAEMTDLALTILQRCSRQVGKPFIMVAETESVDNFGNANNAIGTLTGLKHANDVIETAQRFQQRNRKTLILTAADSDAGGLQVGAWPADRNVATYNNNPTGESTQNVLSPLDGRYGRNSPPFLSEPDAYGKRMAFAVSWGGTPDVSGGINSRAQGLNSAELRRTFRGRFDNTDVYRLMYLTLFGKVLPSSVGQTAPSR
ncbi:MAG: alkaline phosphatase [Roseiflexus sp.]|nr:alkaline phosphatase [Roseiflexus sp.]MCS7290509.1 alkaline phosphatase [Roseiflexus sp.]MDW8148350.1 alkaline phosphatase [Roseiflexaceae bacterium]MDW8232284.1 alkaline phosphatase [Roseiflexaceae bacterium]